jgi:hypothetical protein
LAEHQGPPGLAENVAEEKDTGGRSWIHKNLKFTDAPDGAPIAATKIQNK